MLELSGITKHVKNGNQNRIILNQLQLQVNIGDSIAIKGRSGSGKTTLLKIIAGLVKCDEGNIFFKGKNIAKYTVNERLKYRRNHIGMITQQLNLLDDRNIFENIALPLYYQGVRKQDREKSVKETLDSLGMEDFLYKSISNLSGGERQRIAIARALVKNPSILIADEPTGALDEETEKEILNIFHKLQRKGKTIILVTHNDNVAKSCDYVYELIDGKLESTRWSLT